ncbi:MAG: hypothetical protein WDO70_02705 [Alphaproteobacteria bacterium]
MPIAQSPDYSSSAMTGQAHSRFGHCVMSWPAIIAGAVTMCAVTMVLFLFGSGLGLSSVSPWANTGITATSFTVVSAIWLIVMQWVSSALGGYLAGRMRKQDDNVHPHEAYFSDTAHGFLAWSLATIIAVSLLGSVASGLASGGANAMAHMPPALSATSDRATLAESANPAAYEVDRLFRAVPAAANTPRDAQRDGEARAEAMRILAHGWINEDNAQADKPYLSQLVISQTGISQAEADQRVNEAFERQRQAKEQIKQKADDVRKGASRFAFYTVFSMLIGAFIASAAAALGSGAVLRNKYLPQ